MDWPGLMRAGLGALRLPTDVFWNMTPAELRLALEGAGFLNAQPVLDRSRLSALMEAFPDLGGAVDSSDSDRRPNAGPDRSGATQ